MIYSVDINGVRYVPARQERIEFFVCFPRPGTERFNLSVYQVRQNLEPLPYMEQVRVWRGEDGSWHAAPLETPLEIRSAP